MSGFPLFYWQQNPRLFLTPTKKFPGPFQSLRMFKYNEKRDLLTIFRVQSIAENSAWSKMWTLDVQNSETGCYNIAACFPFKPLEKCMIFEDIFPGLPRTLSFNFQDFPGPKWFFQDFPGPGIFKKKNPGLSRRRGNPVMLSALPAKYVAETFHLTGNYHPSSICAHLCWRKF